MGASALWPILSDLLEGTEIPPRVALGWIAVESDGDIMATGKHKDKETGKIVESKLEEYGYFQVSKEEDTFGRSHGDLRTDKEWSLQAGLMLLQRYRDAAHNAGLVDENELFWKAVKLQHQIGSGVISRVRDYVDDGGDKDSWPSFVAYLEAHPYKRWRWGVDGVNKMWSRGGLLATTVPFVAPVMAPIVAVIGESATNWATIGLEVAALGLLLWYLWRKRA